MTTQREFVPRLSKEESDLTAVIQEALGFEWHVMYLNTRKKQRLGMTSGLASWRVIYCDPNTGEYDPVSNKLGDNSKMAKKPLDAFIKNKLAKRTVQETTIQTVNTIQQEKQKDSPQNDHENNGKVTLADILRKLEIIQIDNAKNYADLTGRIAEIKEKQDVLSNQLNNLHTMVEGSFEEAIDKISLRVNAASVGNERQQTLVTIPEITEKKKLQLFFLMLMQRKSAAFAWTSPLLAMITAIDDDTVDIPMKTTGEQKIIAALPPPPDDDCPAHLGDRSEYIGASLAGTLFGLSSFLSPIHLVAQMKGQIPRAPSNERMRMGNQYEDDILVLFEQDKKTTLGGRQQEFRHVVHDFIRCHVDALWKRIPVEAKLKDKAELYKRHDDSGELVWGPNGSDIVPYDTELQVRTQMLLTGTKEGYLVVAFVDYERLKNTKTLKTALIEHRIYRFEHDQALADLILEKYVHFWRHYIEGNEMPPVVFTSYKPREQVMLANFRVDNTETVLNENAVEIYDAWKAQQAHVKSLERVLAPEKKRCEQLQAQLENTLGRHKKAVLPGRGVFSRLFIEGRIPVPKKRRDTIRITFNQQIGEDDNERTRPDATD